MEVSKEYFKKEYGAAHINHVVLSGDLISLYSLIDEYAKVKTSTLHSELEKARELLKKAEFYIDSSIDFHYELRVFNEGKK